MPSSQKGPKARQMGPRTLPTPGSHKRSTRRSLNRILMIVGGACLCVAVCGVCHYLVCHCVWCVSLCGVCHCLVCHYAMGHCVWCVTVHCVSLCDVCQFVVRHRAVCHCVWCVTV